MPNNNIKSKILEATSSESETDLEFSFYVETINGCNDLKETELEKEVVVTTQPQMPKEVTDQIDVQYDNDSEQFKVNIPASLQNDAKMIKNIPIEMIFTVFWKIEGEEDSYAYMSVIYRVTFISEITIDLKRLDRADKPIDFDLTKQNQVNINDDKDLILSVESSKFAGASGSGYAGLTFRWECAVEGENVIETLIDYCQRWKGSSVLQITSEMFNGQTGWIDKNIKIKVIASSIETSEIVDPIIQE